MTQFVFGSNPVLLGIVTLVVLWLLIELPYRFMQSPPAGAAKADDAWNAVQAGLLTLSAFVVGFSFNQAAARFELRRGLVNSETNAIGTTWLRADQLPAADTKRFRALLTDYTATRLKVYETPGDLESGLAIQRSNADEAILWSIASSAPMTARAQLMAAVNDMIDISATQLHALQSHVPTPMFLLTFALVALGSATIGIRCARDRSRPLLLSIIYVVAYAVIISMGVDYDRPQNGIVKIDFSPLRRELQSMQQRNLYLSVRIRAMASTSTSTRSLNRTFGSPKMCAPDSTT
jgi:hypothetical protein